MLIAIFDKYLPDLSGFFPLHHFSHSSLKLFQSDPEPLKWLRLTTTRLWCCGSRRTQNLPAATLWNGEVKVSESEHILAASGMKSLFYLCATVSNIKREQQ